MLAVLRFWFTKDLVRFACRVLPMRIMLINRAEIRQGKTMQAIQFYTGRVLSSTSACLLEMDRLLFDDTDSSA